MLSGEVFARLKEDAQPPLLVEEKDRGVEVVIANTPALLERVYRLRYEVYCLEKQFEDPGLQLTGYEQDKYDDHAVHALLLDSESGSARGAVRLILPNKECSLPAYEVSEAFRAAAGRAFPMATTAEASRFLRATQSSGCRHTAAFETLALMAGVTQMCWENGVSHLAALVTSPMLRLLHRFGLAFRPIGEPVAFHGRRHACIFDMVGDLSTLARERPEIWRVLTVGGHFFPRTAPYL
ncbi:MAG: GNAT family N-acetyltransferase [Alphaproteobacteria bacterium]|nr:MAG: GNAT family N-acetyltransferase [Alphaproteobacteria bacterium]